MSLPNIDVAAFVAGAVLLLIGVLGGGLEAGSFRVPPLPNVWVRVLAGVLGALLIGVALWVRQAPSATEKAFSNPMYRGSRLDICYEFSVDCGRRSADKWCRSEMDYAGGAVEFEADPSIGSRGIATRNIGSDQTCNAAYCTGYKSITCRK